MKKIIPLSRMVTVILFLLPLLFAVSQASADVVIVVNKSVPATSLTADTIKDIYLGKISSWGNSQKIEFVILKSGDTHEAFVTKYVNKSSSQFSSYWKKMVFTGKGKFPKSFDTEKDLVEYVSSTDGAIGYISTGTDSSSLKIITVQ